MIHLDTNVMIALLNDRPPVVRAKFDAAFLSGAALAISSVVFHELMYGAASSSRRSANEKRITILLAAGRIDIIAFEEADAIDAAEIRAFLRREGTPIGPYDLLIAAQARRAGATLITANYREFQRVPGLAVIDWTA